LNYLACEPWLNESAAERLRKAAGSCKLKLSPLSPPHIFAPLPAGKPAGKDGSSLNFNYALSWGKRGLSSQLM